MKELNYMKTNLIANLPTFICNTVKLICNTEYCKVCCNSAGPCVVCQVSARFFYFLMPTSQNYTKRIIRLRLGKYSPICTLPEANNC